jgi:glycine cleavage system regulatory protein
MYTSLILTVQAPDKPGLVESISSVITAHHGNWLESRMASLAGQFAGILLVQVASEHEAELRAALEALGNGGIHLTITKSGAASPKKRRTLLLELTGQDRPGIVRELSQVLARLSVNIDELETRVAPSSFYGGDIFSAKARVSVPDELDSHDLRSALEAIAHDLLVDLSLAEQTKF